MTEKTIEEKVDEFVKAPLRKSTEEYYMLNLTFQLELHRNIYILRKDYYI